MCRPPMSWLQFSIDVLQDQVEAVSAALEAAGAQSVTLQDAADDLLSEVYGCELRTNVTPPSGAPFVLPSAPSLPV